MKNALKACAWIVLLGLRAAGADPALERAWVKVVELEFNEAAAMFTEIAAAFPALRREADYGRAIALLNTEPVAEHRIAEARRLLEEVRTGGTGDETGMAAWFYLARIEQSHGREQPNYARAQVLYSELAAAHPQDWYGQYALYKYAVLDLTIATLPGERAERLRWWEQRVEEFTIPLFRRNFERALVFAYMLFDLPVGKAVPHAQRSTEPGFARQDLQTNMLIRLCNLAREAGEDEIAIAAARRFLREYPNHVHRQFMVDHLVELTGQEPAPP